MYELVSLSSPAALSPPHFVDFRASFVFFAAYQFAQVQRGVHTEMNVHLLGAAVLQVRRSRVDWRRPSAPGQPGQQSAHRYELTETRYLMQKWNRHGLSANGFVILAHRMLTNGVLLQAIFRLRTVHSRWVHAMLHAAFAGWISQVWLCCLTKTWNAAVGSNLKVCLGFCQSQAQRLACKRLVGQRLVVVSNSETL